MQNPRSEARALARSLGREKRLEDVTPSFERNTRSGVAHNQDSVGPWLQIRPASDAGRVRQPLLDLDMQRSATRHGIASIDGEVDDHLLDLSRVYLH